MRVCLLGKYPPIQGGVSVNDYWTAYGLAERGHEVFVVTNAGEVEDDYRLRFLPGDAEKLVPAFPPPGAAVRVFETESFGPAMGHIPLANPFVTKLSSLATQILRRYSCDLLYACYFEPYAMAGALASGWTGVPLLVNHAGSDLERMMRVPQLATAYKEVLKAAAGVVTLESLVERFVAMGVAEERILYDPPFALPTEVFHPEAEPFDIEEALAGLAAAAVPESEILCPARPFDPARPTIGLYGKIGEFKGSFDLVAALAQLRRDGLDFNFLALSQGHLSGLFREAITAAGLGDRSWILPFLPHWRIPGFLRACTAVCFLERDFPIAIHGPMVPREVLACGVCLVVSGEVAGKQRFRGAIADRENAVVVPDPKDHAALAADLAFVLTDPARAREIGRRGHLLTAGMEDFPAYVANFEAMLLDFLDRTRPGPAGPRPTALRAHHLARTAPALPWLLGDRFAETAELYLEEAAPGANRLQASLGLCRFVAARLAAGKIRLDRWELPLALEVLRYQEARLVALVGKEEGEMEPPPADVLRELHASPESMRGCRPLLAARTWIETFEHDLTPLFQGAVNGRGPAHAVEKRKIHVCFHRSPNLAGKELLISAETKALLTLCDGTRETEALVLDLARELGAENQEEVSQVRGGSLEALARLHQAGVVLFTRGGPLL